MAAFLFYYGNVFVIVWIGRHDFFFFFFFFSFFFFSFFFFFLGSDWQGLSASWSMQQARKRQFT